MLYIRVIDRLVFADNLPRISCVVVVAAAADSDDDDDDDNHSLSR